MSELVKREETLPGDPAQLLTLAVEKDLDVEKLERLVALQERHNELEAKRQFNVAMARFQSECPDIGKKRVVKNRSGEEMYRYASLDDIVNTVGELERECGFTHRFNTSPTENGGAEVECIVSHTSGHDQSTKVFVPPTKGMNTNASQDTGIVITYGKRYSFCNAFGIVTDITDNDANADNSNPITPEQEATIEEWIEKSGSDKTKLLQWAGVKTLGEFPSDKFSEAVAMMKKKVSQ